MTDSSQPLWVIVPAAGSGTRMQASLAKQYLPLAGQCVLQWTLATLCKIPALERIVIAVQDEAEFARAVSSDPRYLLVAGGSTRAASVQNALAAVCAQAGNPWVLVHDAARPCVKLAEIDKLIDTVLAADCGGILARPAADTVKSVTDAHISNTLDRAQIWLAHTPQMFRAQDLLNALAAAAAEGVAVTDEAQAMELAGYAPLVVADSRDNIKITHPEDLALAEWLLAKRQQENDE